VQTINLPGVRGRFDHLDVDMTRNLLIDLEPPTYGNQVYLNRECEKH